MTNAVLNSKTLLDPLFETLLFVASEEGRVLLPSIEEALVLEVMSGTLAYVAGSEVAEKVPLFHNLMQDVPRKHIVNEFMKEEMAKHGSSLHPSLSEALLKMTFFEFKSDHGERWHDTPLRWMLEFLQCRNPLRSTFSLSVIFVEEAKADKEQLLPDIQQQCEAIGIAMRPYVARDVKYIQENYRW